MTPPRARSVRILMTIAVGATLCLAPSLAASMPVAARSAWTTSSPSEDRVVARVERAVEAARRHAAIPDVLTPAVSELKRDHVDVEGCGYVHGEHVLCRRGDADSDKVLVALGDSHARMWIPALEKVAKRTHYATYYLAKSGCTPARVTPNVGGGPFRGCVAWREWAITKIRQLRPDIVVLGSFLPPGVVLPDGHTVTKPSEVTALVRKGLVDTVRVLGRRVVDRVFIVGDPPGLAQSADECLAGSDADLGDCASPASRADRLLIAAQRQAAKATRAGFIRTRPWFCAEGLCPAVVGSTVTYRDDGHITTVYSRALNRALQAALGVRPQS
jgi:hypothetical protein